KIAEIINPRLTRKDANIIKVILDNGEEIRCTPNHKFLQKNGEYKEAEFLQPGDSLMPAYFKLSAKADNKNLAEYKMIFQPKNDSWDYIHVLADKWNIENGIYEKSTGRTRHHVDFDKLNNNPDNIQRMNWQEHWQTHYEFTSSKHGNDADYRQKLADGRNKFWSDDTNRVAYSQRMSQRNLKNWKNDTYRKKMINSLRQTSKQFLIDHPERLELIKKTSSTTMKRLWQIPEYKQLFHEKISACNKKRKHNLTGKVKFLRVCKYLLEKKISLDQENFEQIRSKEFGRSFTRWDLGLDKYYQNDKNLLLCELNGNHKVARIELLNESVDVYDLTIDKTHNFALAAGIFVHNSMDGDSAAAMRYTEAKLAHISEEMLNDIDKNTVNFIPNYDGAHKEPQVLPAKLPNLLINGTQGIAVGMATNIPPHNLAEIVDGIVYLTENPDCEIEDLCKFIKGPDFPTGGIIYNKENIKQAYLTGRGGIVCRAKAEIEETKNGLYRIIVSEVNYQTNKSTLLEKIADLVKEKKIEGIKDLRDESNKDGVRIVIEIKKDAYPQKILNQLYKQTALQDTFHFNVLALVDGIQPKVLNLKAVLEEFLKHRKEVVTRRTQFDLDKAKDRAHILEGLVLALQHIDEIIATIKKSKDKEEAKTNLIKKFKLSERQSVAILEMKLQQLANLEKIRIETELKEKLKIIKELEAILKSPARILAIIKEEILELKEKYAEPRRTQIVAHGVDSFKAEDLIPDENTMIMVTNDGYIKRLPPDTFKTQGRGGKGVIGLTTKEEDVVEHCFLTSTHADIMFFTNRGRVFQLKGYDLPQASRTAKGQALVNFLQLAQNEKVSAILPSTDIENDKFLVMVTNKGTIKKTPIEDFKNVRRSGLIAIKLHSDDDLNWVQSSKGNENIILISREGQAIRFKETDVRSMGRASSGVRGFRLKSKDEVVGMGICDNKDDKVANILIIMEHGYGKQTELKNYKVQGRGGSGIKTAKITPKTGKIISGKLVYPDDKEMIVISTGGQVIRLALEGVSILGRDTQGVRVMRFKEENDTVANITLI
ncbi:MAG: DNA gyrase subunit A, partial [Candidatus Buchananbacteria bacterium]